MASRYRSAFRTLLLSLTVLACGCGPLEPEVETFAIRAHSLDASERCKVVANPNVQIQALGPFPVSPRSAEVLPFRTPEQTLTFPDDTQGVEATATDFESTWLGYSDRRANQGIDVLLWKERTACELYDPALEPDPEKPTYPVPNGGQAIGYSPDAGIVLVAGGDSSSAAAQSSLVFHAGDGLVDLVPQELRFPQARAYATVTPFGSGLLLAGGEDPLVTDVVPDRIARDSAVFYDPAVGGFEGETIELELARTRHAAVVLDSGETLLVGGGRHSGGGTTLPVDLLEAVSPSTRRTRLGAELGSERLEPVALRLSDGRVLVGGGYGIDHEPMTTLEWFSPDGASVVTPECLTPLPCELEARHHRAFVAMPGGGALTAGGCAPGPQTEDCIAACGENFGCPAAEFDATWIAPDGALTTVTLEQPLSACPGVTPATPFSPEHVWLAPGSEGAPWLIAFDEDLDPPCRSVFRLEPWENAPVCGDIEGQCVVFAPVAFALEGNFPDPKTALTSLGPDVFVWLTEGDPPRFAGVRAGIRGALSQNEVLLGTAPSTPLVPLHLGPDRPPHGATSRVPKALYRPGRLILEPENANGTDVVVTLTDARYDDVTLSIGFSGNGPPLVRFDSYEVGGDDCAWPSDAATPLTVTRRAGSIEASEGAGRSTSCKNAPPGAVTLGFRAGRIGTTITSLEVKRN